MALVALEILVKINSYCACLPSYLEYIPLSTLRSTYGKVLTEGYISRFFVVKRNKNYYDSPRESYALSWGRDTFCEVILNYEAKKIGKRVLI